MDCPRCGDEAMRDEIHNGLAWLYGPWGCHCGWSEDERYCDSSDPRVDPFGGFTPSDNAKLAGLSGAALGYEEGLL